MKRSHGWIPRRPVRDGLAICALALAAWWSLEIIGFLFFNAPAITGP